MCFRLVFVLAICLPGCKKTPAPAPPAEPAKAAPAAAPKATEATDQEAMPEGKVVELKTSMGSIKIELDREKAPKSVANFLRYVKDGHYDGTIFHRVIDGFMIQGGGFTADLKKKETRAPIQNEADNGLKNLTGTVAMARTMNPHSASAQFFINVKDNAFLDHRDKSMRGWGYTVFGKVIEGMSVVDEIKGVKTGPCGPFSKDCPQETVTIESARILR